MINKIKKPWMNRQIDLSKENTDSIRGLCAVLIFLSHIPSFCGVPSGIVGTLFRQFGFTCVAVFLFLSGFGITTQYILKNENYLKTFLKKHVLYLYIVELILICIYICVKIILGRSVVLFDVIGSFLYGRTVVSNGWYIQLTIILYLVFWIVFKFFKISFLKKLLILLFFCILYIFICIIFRMEEVWYVSVLAFPVGSFYAYYQDRISKPLKTKSYLFIIPVSLLTYIISSFARIVLKNSIVLRTGFFIISAISFVFLAILVCGTIRISKCSILRFIGKISFEIYVLQGLMFIIMSTFSDGYLQALFAFCGTVLLAIPTNKAFVILKKKLQNS